jgi:hypothetical protein
MSKFIIGVSEGIAKVYPYGQISSVEKVLKEGEALLCQVPVGPHPEPYVATSGVITDPDSVVIPDAPTSKPTIQPETKEHLQGLAEEDKNAPAAGVDDDSSPGDRTGMLLVSVLEGKVKVRTYESSRFTEQDVEQGASVSVAVTESNRITLAVYEAAPVVDPRK